MAGRYRFRLTQLASAVLVSLVAPPAARAAEQVLSEINVQEQAERADGPVDGYRATRSSTATKTDTPIKDIPSSLTVVPAQLMEDQAMRSMGDVFRYVPGVLMHQGEGNRDQIVIPATAPRPISTSTACVTTRRCSATCTTSSASRC